MKVVFLQDGSHGMHKNWRTHERNFMRHQMTKLSWKHQIIGGPSFPLEEGAPQGRGSDDTPMGPLTLGFRPIAPPPSSGQHANKHIFRWYRPLMIWLFDPRDDVQRTWICEPTSTNINRGTPHFQDMMNVTPRSIELHLYISASRII
jgi:hypothetical protein